MTERELSEKLDKLADTIEGALQNNEGRPPISTWHIFLEVAKELRNLSNQKYTPGSIGWGDLKQQSKSAKNRYPF